MLRAKLGLKTTNIVQRVQTRSFNMPSLTASFINEPHHLRDSSSSCIDLIFTSQPNLFMESGVQPSLHPNYHHQLVFAKFDSSIYYPPPYERTVWLINRENFDLI